MAGYTPRVDLKKRNYDLDDQIIQHAMEVKLHPEYRGGGDFTVGICPQCNHRHFTIDCRTTIAATNKLCGCPSANAPALPHEFRSYL